MMLAFVLAGCDGFERADTATAQPSELTFRWVRGYPGDSWERAEAGLWWALADLGALSPVDGSALSIQAETAEQVRFTLDFDALGFGSTARAALQPAIDETYESDEYAARGAMDISRFLARTLYEPWRYYAITGACPTMDERPLGPSEPYGVTISTLVAGHRLISLPVAPAAIVDLVYRAEEGEGSLIDGTFVANEYEFVDIMANGRFRYARYDASGKLRSGEPGSPAGQPGKCLWCHETTIQLGTSENESPYLSYEDWIIRAAEAQAMVDTYQAANPSAAEDSVAETHELAELLVESFMWPDAERVALEWVESAEGVRKLGLPTTDLREYGWVDRFRRADIDPLWADGAPLGVVVDTREALDESAYSSAEIVGCGGAASGD